MKVNGSDLYIIQAACTGVVKIGRTWNVEQRLSQLQTGCPYKLRVILHMPGKGHMEKFLHFKLEDYIIRWNGEWFSEEGLPSLPDHIYELLDLEIMDWWRDPRYIPKSDFK